MAGASTPAPMGEFTRYDSLPKLLKALFLALTSFGIGLFIFYLFGWNIRGFYLPCYHYYYLLAAVFFSSVFLLVPARKKDRNKVPWYDLVAFALAFGAFIYCFLNATSIVRGVWMPPPSTFALVSACIIGLLALESCRRIGGPVFSTICLICGVYPLFADHMPGVLYGAQFSFPYTIGAYAFGPTGLLGLPMQMMGEILVGFLLFAAVLMASGGGRFFLNLALCLVGRFRGGPAKVAVVASGFFGSLSGSISANVVATGSVTIPAMKRLGYPPHYAGAIEACASTAGPFTPPVMGGIAFIICIFTGIPYAEIIVAVSIPVLLYYFGLLMQVDAYAAKVGLKGLPREEIPSLLKTLKEGWIFIASLFFLVFGLLYMRWEMLAPIYASGFMFLLSFTTRATRMTPRAIIGIVTTTGSLILTLMGMIVTVGFIMVGMNITGVGAAITMAIMNLGTGNLILILLMGVAACYLMGMAGLGGIAYIVLAVTLAPALVNLGGLNLLAIHLFILMYAMMGGLTPPVAVVAFIAAALAGAPPMKTAFTAMRLAVVIYFIPFFFLFNSSLILQGSILETLYLFALCLVGIAILAGGLEGYLVMVGRLKLWARPLLIAAGFLIALPEWKTTIYGAASAALVIAIILILKKTTTKKLVTGNQ